MTTCPVLTNARLILGDECIHGDVILGTDGLITDVVPTSHTSPHGLDLEGDLLAPGMVELHTDTLERHVQPRSWVVWDAFTAALAHDGQIATAGITTVFDALALIGGRKHGNRHEILGQMVSGLAEAEAVGALRVEHFLHLRCEAPEPQLLDMLSTHLDNPRLGFLSIMDHTPGQRQFADLDTYRKIRRISAQIDDATIEHDIQRLQATAAEYGPRHRAELARIARDGSLALATHDDETPAHVDEAAAIGAVVSEFPTTMVAARAARDRGLRILMGAPNIMRGGSHSGNISAGALAREDLLDILSSDYIPISLLSAVLRLTREPFAWSLPKAMATVSRTPAQVAGLTDRGRIAPGLRADLIQVHVINDKPVIRSVWSRGRRVA